MVRWLSWSGEVRGDGEGEELGNYIIKGGEQGRARLSVIARVLAPTTEALLDRFEPLQGSTVIDAGCGGGDVSFELAERVGTSGRVIAFDLDEAKIAVCPGRSGTARARQCRHSTRAACSIHGRPKTLMSPMSASC